MVLTRKRAREQQEAAPTTSAVDDHQPPPLRSSSQSGRGADDSEDDEEVGEEEDDEDVVLSETYAGPRDQQGHPHGEGCISITFQRGRRRGLNRFTGRFERGEKSHLTQPAPHAAPVAIPLR